MAKHIDPAEIARILKDARSAKPSVSVHPTLPAWEAAICVLVAVFLGFALAAGSL
jgi:hypothetical protein